MGILNLTPDSFSDGGAYPTHAAAIAAGRAMHEAGAAIIDAGAESTRPGAPPIPAAEQLTRLLPVVAALARAAIRVCVDTRSAAVMRACLDAGAAMVNDVSALTHDPDAAPLVAARGCPVILMHMRGTPQTMHAHAVYTDILAEVRHELRARRDAAEQAGIARASILLDPGLGFAKTEAHTIALLSRLNDFEDLGCPLVVGASRKRFLGGAGPQDRLGGSIAAAILAAQHGASILRVHDVPETIQALHLLHAVASTPATSTGGRSGV